MKTVSHTRERICKNLQNVWPGLSAGSLVIHETGGLTNTVHIVETPFGKVVHREFGSLRSAGSLQDRLLQAGIAPHVLFETSGVQVTEFIEGQQMVRTQMRQWAGAAARQIACFHEVELTTEETTAKPQLLDAIQSWGHTLAENYDAYLNSVTKPDRDRLSSLRYLFEEGQSDVLAYIPDAKTTVLSHNDLCYVNIIITPYDNLRFIDYDYAGPNPRGVDLATYINETAYELELPEYPFFTHVANEEMTSCEVEGFLREYCSEMEAEYEVVSLEVAQCRVAVNFMGALWAAVNFRPQDSGDTNKFDMLGYATKRLSEYNRLRQELM